MRWKQTKIVLKKIWLREGHSFFLCDRRISGWVFWLVNKLWFLIIIKEKYKKYQLTVEIDLSFNIVDWTFIQVEK